MAPTPQQWHHPILNPLSHQGTPAFENTIFHGQWWWWRNEFGVRVQVLFFLPQIHCLGFSLPCGSDESIQIVGPRWLCKNWTETRDIIRHSIRKAPDLLLDTVCPPYRSLHPLKHLQPWPGARARLSLLAGLGRETLAGGKITLNFCLFPVPANPQGEEMLSKSEMGRKRERERQRREAGGLHSPCMCLLLENFNSEFNNLLK